MNKHLMLNLIFVLFSFNACAESSKKDTSKNKIVFYESNTGSVEISKKDQKIILFKINETSNMASTCELSGEAHQTQDSIYEFKDNESCKVTIDLKKANIVIVDTADDCQTYCGSGAAFGTEYRVQPSYCKKDEIEKVNLFFLKKFKENNYNEAYSALDKKINECQFFIKSEILAQMRSDLSLTALKLNKKADCLDQIKLARKENPNLDPEMLKSLPDSSYYDKISKISKSLSYNEKKCK